MDKCKCHKAQGDNMYCPIHGDKDIIRESKAVAELPDCSCGWSGKGTGRGGKFVKGDRCPKCGESLA